MEKLAKEQQESIKKMSSSRLQKQLIDSGMQEETVREMDRQALLHAYAQSLSSGTLVQAAEAVPSGYDPDVERERLDLQRQQLAWEMKKHDDEMRKHDDEMKKTQ